MELPNTSGSFDPGYLAASGSRDVYKVLCHVGCSSTGTANLLTKCNSNSLIESSFGLGPLVRVGKNALAKLRVPQLLCKAATAVAGSCGLTRYAASSTASESATPEDIGTVVFSGAALDDFELLWKFTVGGVIGGDARGRLSLDNGSTWLDEVAVSGATIVNALSGVTLTFSDDAGDFPVGTYWRCRTVAPAMSVAGMSAALDALSTQMVERFGMVVVHQGWNTDDLAEALEAAEDAAQDGPAKLNLYSCFLSFRRQDVTGEDGFGTAGAPETDAQYETSAVGLEYAGGLRVLKSHGEFRTQDLVHGLKPRRLKLENEMYRFVASDYKQELMDTDLGPIEDVLTSYSTEEIGGSLYPRQWLVTRQHPGYVGHYLAGGLMSTPPDNKMKYIYVRRIADLIEERLRRYAVHVYGKFAAALATGGLTTDAQRFWSGEFYKSAMSLIDGNVLLGIVVTVADSTTNDSTVQMVVGWDFTVALPVGSVTLNGSFSIGQ